MKKSFLHTIMVAISLTCNVALSQDQSWIYSGENIPLSFIFDFKKNNYAFPPEVTLHDKLTISYLAATVSDTMGNLKLTFSVRFLEAIGNYRDTSDHTRLFNDNKFCRFDKNDFAESSALTQQSRLLLPHPDKANHYMLFTLEQVQERIFRLYYSLIDLTDNTYNAEAKQIIIRKQAIMEDSLEAGRLTVCRHPNGKDWWLLLGKRDPNNKLAFQRFLINSEGVTALGVQYTNHKTILDPKSENRITKRKRLGAVYAPNGNYYVRYVVDEVYEQNGDTASFELFQFDRCNGKIITQNVKTFKFKNKFSSGGGAAFSANSRYLYLTDGIQLIQYDILTNQQSIIAQKEDQFCFLGCDFKDLKLAPDNRIYILGDRNKQSMSVILDPNNQGQACNLALDTIKLKENSLVSGSFPNLPYYRLGKANCGVSTDDISSLAQNIVLYPNPTENTINISLAADSSIPNNATVECYDMLGRLIYANDWTTNTLLQIGCAHWQSGMYICKIKANNQIIVAKKFVKQ